MRSLMLFCIGSVLKKSHLLPLNPPGVECKPLFMYHPFGGRNDFKMQNNTNWSLNLWRKDGKLQTNRWFQQSECLWLSVKFDIRSFKCYFCLRKNCFLKYRHQRKDKTDLHPLAWFTKTRPTHCFIRKHLKKLIVHFVCVVK